MSEQYAPGTNVRSTPLNEAPSEESATAEQRPSYATPAEAWDAAVDALTPEQLSEWREARVFAARAGFDAPNPPGYRPPPSEAPADAASEEADELAALEEEISEASAAGDWERSRALKHRYTDIHNRRRLASANGGARFYGRDGR